MSSPLKIVVDASVAATWLLPDETNANTADVLGAAGLHAPWLFWAEMRNILVVAERRKRLDRPMLGEAVALLEGLHIVFDSTPTGDRVMALARGHGLSVYDALYLELAQRLGAPLLTLDQKLAKAASQEGVDLLV